MVWKKYNFELQITSSSILINITTNYVFWVVCLQWFFFQNYKTKHEYYFFIVLYQDPHGRSKLFSVPSRERSKGKGFNINVSVKPGTIQKKCLTHWSYYWQIVCEWFENFRNFPSKYLCFSGKKSWKLFLRIQWVAALWL